METTERTRILDNAQIAQTIRRIAHQILEEMYKEKQICIVGIKGIGSDIADQVSKEFKQISDIECQCMTITLNKDKPLQSEIVLSEDKGMLKNRCVILIDDVLNSGRTLIHAASFIIEANPKVLRTAVLVDRIHRKFPIRADFVGLSLSTNLKEHVAVVKTGKKYEAFLD